MHIDFDIFLDWVDAHFDKVKVTNGKIKVNSLFCDHLGGDKKQHLWCKPSINSFRCFKSGRQGDLYELVSLVEGIPRGEAVEILGGEQTLRNLEQQLSKYFGKDKEEIVFSELNLPKDSFLISKLSAENHWRQRAEKYLTGRKLPSDGLYIGVGGDFQNRIIIPYYNREGKLVYYNGRDLSGLSKLRYKGPGKETGADKSKVLWMKSWPKAGSKIYLTEGEFDAWSLSLCGFHGAASGGKDITHAQIQLLKSYQVVIAFDTDDSGKDALVQYGDSMLKEGIDKIFFVRPPTQCKDWNEMYCKYGKEMVKAYIQEKELPFSEWTSSLLKIFDK